MYWFTIGSSRASDTVTALDPMEAIADRDTLSRWSLGRLESYIYMCEWMVFVCVCVCVCVHACVCEREREGHIRAEWYE